MDLRIPSRAAGRLRLAALVALPVLALSAACGGGGDPLATGEEIASVPGDTASGGEHSGNSGKRGDQGAFYDAQMDYVQCMRGKGGVKDFPDPKLSGYLDWTKIDEISRKPGNEEASKGGKNGVCGKEMSAAMRLEPKRDVQKQYESMLAHAACMRKNGVSKFTNPTLSGGNVIPGGDPDPAASQIDTSSPAYKQARQACKDKLLDGLDGMQ
ncbi:hypothetical protein MUU72_00655 [Streptomyces sp. RS10V-4]|uniref:hypothetical protein n=1 Tax=Streptomyces rhizoryzae TaxID=2932493 RepID=UPI0020062748|nr:hypothetical protein [Streptomyces rhizoryzae]MCK7621655.1 hypothetical protein [Streptomyces rhizoryzae]